MKVHRDYPEYKMAVQWAKEDFLPKMGSAGLELWSNQFCRSKYVYYSPNDVEPADPEQLRAFFAADRERRNLHARELRKRLREKDRREKEYQTEYNARKQTRAAILPCVTELSRLYLETPPLSRAFWYWTPRRQGLTPTVTRYYSYLSLTGQGQNYITAVFYHVRRNGRTRRGSTT